MDAINFVCPQCEEKVFVKMAYLDPTSHEVYLVADCKACDETWRFSIDKLFAELYGNHLMPRDRRTH